jgi:uncharacterized protein YigA (DUF484 family)
MFDNLGTFVTLLIGVLAIAAAGGTGWQRGRISQLRERVSDLEGVRDENKELRRDLDALGRVVTGEAHWTAISSQLHDHDVAAREHWTAQLALLTRLAKAAERNTE